MGSERANYFAADRADLQVAAKDMPIHVLPDGSVNGSYEEAMPLPFRLQAAGLFVRLADRRAADRLLFGHHLERMRKEVGAEELGEGGRNDVLALRQVDPANVLRSHWKGTIFIRNSVCVLESSSGV